MSHNRSSAPVSRIPTLARRQEEHGFERTISAPSKLDLMKRQFQRNLKVEKERNAFAEKEQKLIDLYERNQEKALIRVGHKPSGISRDELEFGNNITSRENGIVRDFFKERRTFETESLRGTPRQTASDNIQYHFNKKRAEYGRPPIYKKTSAGKDRDHLLDPINVNSQNRIQTSPNAPSNNSNSRPNKIDNQPHPPVAQRPRLARTPKKGVKPSNKKYVKGSGSDSDVSVKEQQQIRAPRIHRKKIIDNNDEIDNAKDGKLSNFQQWQLEQQRLKDLRLEKFRARKKEENERAGYQSDESEEGTTNDQVSNRSYSTGLMNNKNNEVFSPINNNTAESTPSPKVSLLKKKAMVLKQQKLQISAQADEQDEEEVEGEESMEEAGTSDASEESEISRKQQELVELIKKQQAELEMMQEERRKEEIRELEDQERFKEQQLELEIREKILREQEEARLAASENDTSKSSSRSTVIESPKKKQKTPQRPKPQTYRVPTEVEENEGETPPFEPSNGGFYAEMAGALDDAQSSGSMNLLPCSTCGRKFAADRLAKHANVCTEKASKKRKVFDPVKMRTAGTEMANFVPKEEKKVEKKPRKMHWRQQHEDFLKTIRYAKKVTEVEQEGGNLADLPPPPVTENPDYVQCEYCKRRFNPAVAERHIPRCKDIKCRPKPPKGKR